MSTVPLSILTIEDDLAQAVLLREFLGFSGPDGLTVEHVSTLGAALEIIEPGRFDVIVTDLSLPDSRGSSTVAKLRDGAPGVPVVVMSGQMESGVRAEVAEAGAADFIVKGQVEYQEAVVRILRAVERAEGGGDET
jgi:two-component system, NarL family, sensor histidine kinase UhpB